MNRLGVWDIGLELEIMNLEFINFSTAVENHRNREY